MPPRLRRLSGEEVIQILCKQFNFEVVARRGSHVKLRRLAGGQRQTLTVPAHPELDRGTLHAIFRQACRYIANQELRSHFYTGD
ncbi:MAG: type II toxin-antitoxin system HicA family toxin [Thermoanaerobaculales bacterium]